MPNVEGGCTYGINQYWYWCDAAWANNPPPVVSNNTAYYSGGPPNPGGGNLTCTYKNGAIVGQTFGGGFYVQVVMYLTNASRQFVQGAGLWIVPSQVISGQWSASHTFTEWDFMEFANGLSFHWWQNGPTNTGSDWRNSYYNNIDFSGAPHTFGYLWVPASRTGTGQGILASYLDGVQISNYVYSRNGQYYDTISGYNPGFPNGAFWDLEGIGADTETFCIDILTPYSGGDPITFGPIQVWQHP